MICSTFPMNERMQVGLFEVPKIPKILKLFKSQNGIKEIFGCHHMKYLVFDNDVILTGFLKIYKFL